MKKTTLADLMKNQALTMQNGEGEPSEFTVSLDKGDGNKERLIVLPEPANPNGIQVELRPASPDIVPNDETVRLNSTDNQTVNGVVVVDGNFAGDVVIRYVAPEVNMQSFEKLVMQSGEVDGVFVVTGAPVLPGQEVKSPFPASSPTPPSASPVTNDATTQADKSTWANKLSDASNAVTAVDPASGGASTANPPIESAISAEPSEPVSAPVPETPPAEIPPSTVEVKETVVEEQTDENKVVIKATNADVSVAAANAASVDGTEGNTGEQKAEALAEETTPKVEPESEDESEEEPVDDELAAAEELPTEEERRVEEELVTESFNFQAEIESLKQYANLSMQDGEPKQGLFKRALASFWNLLQRVWARIKGIKGKGDDAKAKIAADKVKAESGDWFRDSADDINACLTNITSDIDVSIKDALTYLDTADAIDEMIADIVKFIDDGAKGSGKEPLLELVNDRIKAKGFDALPGRFKPDTGNDEYAKLWNEERSKLLDKGAAVSATALEAHVKKVITARATLETRLAKDNVPELPKDGGLVLTGSYDGNAEALDKLRHIVTTTLHRLVNEAVFYKKTYNKFIIKVSLITDANLNMQSYQVPEQDWQADLSELVQLDGDEKEVKEKSPGLLRRALAGLMRFLQRVATLIAEKSRKVFGKIRMKRAKSNLDVVQKDVVPLLLEHKSDSAFDYLSPKRVGSEGIKSLAAGYGDLKKLVDASRDSLHLIGKVSAGLNTKGISVLTDAMLGDATGLLETANTLEPYAISFTKQADSLTCNEARDALTNLKSFFNDMGSLSDWSIGGLKDIDKLINNAFNDNPDLQIPTSVLDKLSELNQASGKLNHLLINVFNCAGQFVAALAPELKMESFTDEVDVGESPLGESRLVITSEPFEPATAILVRGEGKDRTQIDPTAYVEHINDSGVGDGITIVDPSLTGDIDIIARPVQAVALDLEEAVGGENDPVVISVEERDGQEVRIATVMIDDAAEDAAEEEMEQMRVEAAEAQEARESRIGALNTVDSMIDTALRLGYNGDVEQAELVMEGFLDGIKNMAAKVGNWYDKSSKYQEAYLVDWKKKLAEAGNNVRRAKGKTAKSDRIDLGRIVRMLTINEEPVTDANQLVKELQRITKMAEDIKANIVLSTTIMERMRGIIQKTDLAKPDGSLVLKETEKLLKSLGKPPMSEYITGKEVQLTKANPQGRYDGSNPFLGETLLIKIPSRYQICTGNPSDVVRNYVGTIVCGWETRWTLPVKVSSEAKLLAPNELDNVLRALEKAVNALNFNAVLTKAYQENIRITKILRAVEDFDRDFVNAYAVLLSVESRMFNPMEGIMLVSALPLQAVARLINACAKQY